MVDFHKVIQAAKKVGKKRTFSQSLAPADSYLVDFYKNSASSLPFKDQPLPATLKESVPVFRPVVSEKVEVLHSMKEFVRPKLETSLSTKIKGGEIHSKNDASTVVRHLDLVLQEENWESYLHRLNKCKKCEAAVSMGVVHQYGGLELTAPLDVLFVIDRPKDFDRSCFDEQGNIVDMARWEEAKEHYFVGEKEQMVQRMVQKMNLDSSKFALTSIIKCSLEDKSKLNFCQNNCLSHLLHEIYFLRPKVIVTFGAWSSEVLRGKSERLSTIHGQFYPLELSVGSETINCSVVPLFHPDLLFINNDMKKTTWLDMQKIMDFLK